MKKVKKSKKKKSAKRKTKKLNPKQGAQLGAFLNRKYNGAEEVNE